MNRDRGTKGQRHKDKEGQRAKETAVACSQISQLKRASGWRRFSVKDLKP